LFHLDNPLPGLRCASGFCRNSMIEMVTSELGWLLPENQSEMV
jgi:hypothetical protein